jgi:hypothetical protein
VRYAKTMLLALAQPFFDTAKFELKKEFWRRAISVFGGVEPRDTFLGCFCEEDDLLSQWRGYGQRNDAFSLVFDPKRMGARRDRAFELRRVIYEPDVQRSFVAECLKAADTALDSVGAADMAGLDPLAIVGTFLEDHVREFIVTFKDPAFCDEHEWRAVVNNLDPATGQVDVRLTDQAALIPYVQLDLGWRPDIDMLPLSQIRIGPNANAELTERAVMRILQNHGYDHVDVVRSTVPLR